MNDLEAKLRALTFREPPPGWRGSMVDTAVSESDWRKWLAPHPAAWVALAAIWAVLAFVSNVLETPSSSSTPMAKAREPERLVEPSLFAFQLRAASGLEPPL
jgi:hypothetical protein